MALLNDFDLQISHVQALSNRDAVAAFFSALVSTGVQEDANGLAQATANEVHHLRRPFQGEPDFGVTSVSYDLKELLAGAEGPNERQGRHVIDRY